MFPFAEPDDESPRTKVAVNLCRRVGVCPSHAMSVLKDFELSPFPLHMAAGEDADYLDEMLHETVSREFELKTLTSAESAIVCRYHAVQFAVQTGTPFLAVIYDDKVSRFLEDHGLQDLGVQPSEFDTLPNRLNSLLKNKTDLLPRIRRLRDQLVREGHKLRAALSCEVAAIAEQPVSLKLRIRRNLDRIANRY